MGISEPKTDQERCKKVFSGEENCKLSTPSHLAEYDNTWKRPASTSIRSDVQRSRAFKEHGHRRTPSSVAQRSSKDSQHHQTHH